MTETWVPLPSIKKNSMVATDCISLGACFAESRLHMLANNRPTESNNSNHKLQKY